MVALLTLSLLSIAAISNALEFTVPSASVWWLNSQINLVKWVNPDPLIPAMTLTLFNDQPNSTYNEFVLQAVVTASDLSITVPLLDLGVSTGNYYLKFTRNGTVLATSDKFDVRDRNSAYPPENSGGVGGGVTASPGSSAGSQTGTAAPSSGAPTSAPSGSSRSGSSARPSSTSSQPSAAIANHVNSALVLCVAAAALAVLA